MKAYQVTNPGDPLELHEVETPKPSGQEVLLKTISCGVCHSDVHIHEGAFDLGNGNKMELDAAGIPVPYTLGHEIFGEVIDMGADASVEKGMKFVIYPWIGCGDCEICSTGEEHLCNAAQNIGVQKSGGFGDHVLVPDSKYLYEAGDIEDHLAGSYACSGLTAYSALKKGAPYYGNNKVVIVGVGGVGMMGLQIAKAAFDCNPIVVDVDDAKLELALENGASAAFNSSKEDSMMQILEQTEGGALTVIDFVGSELSVGFGINLLAKGGKYVIVGLYGGELRFPLPLIPLMERCIQGSYVGSPQDMTELMALVRDNKVDPIPIEKRNASEAHQTLLDLKDGKIIGRVALIHD
tara:strand:+ start:17632 stop:18684 length:1053 start_codon:yes stop_codon:yes gene_type:complete